MIAPVASATSTSSSNDHGATSSPRCEWPAHDASFVRVAIRRRTARVDPIRSNQTLNVSPCASHVSRPKNAMARTRHECVADQKQAKLLSALDAEHELQPDDDDEADDRRPAAKALRKRRRLAAPDAQTLADTGEDLVDCRKRVEPRPDGAQQRAEQGQPDPAIDPQEERRNVAVAVTAEERLGDDPQPRDEAHGLQSVAQPDRQRVRPSRRGGAAPSGKGGGLLRTITNRNDIATASAAPTTYADERQWRFVALVQLMAEGCLGEEQQAGHRGEQRRRRAPRGDGSFRRAYAC